jgi:signal transduction histidine kinase
MKQLRAFFASMTGRVFVILALGLGGAALVAVAITDATNHRSFEQQLIERTADRLQGYVAFLDASPPNLRELVMSSGGPGIHQQPAGTTGTAPDAIFQASLRSRTGPLQTATSQLADFALCFPEIRNLAREDIQRALQSEEFRQAIARASATANAQNKRPRAQDLVNMVPPVCRLVTLTLTDGTSLRFSLDTPWVQRERGRLLNPAFLAMLAAAIIILAYVVARIASAPLKNLAKAAAELGRDLDRAPVDVSGPAEVRGAAEAFNAMQKRLQQHVSERTNMLAAITHDLQTPLTRLRLRLEKVEDEALREKLVADLAAMKALIDEGLELARSAETSEPKVMLDLDSVLESLVEDAVDAGGEALFEGGSHAVMQLRPLAIGRLFSNLIDNALKHGGSAAVSASSAGGEVTVRVRDRGPGLPEDMLEKVFDPFVRVDSSRSRQTGGAGLGLTIARALAEKNGATLTLRNHPEGGLEAVVRWPASYARESGASRVAAQ